MSDINDDVQLTSNQITTEQQFNNLSLLTEEELKQKENADQYDSVIMQKLQQQIQQLKTALTEMTIAKDHSDMRIREILTDRSIIEKSLTTQITEMENHQILTEKQYQETHMLDAGRIAELEEIVRKQAKEIDQLELKLDAVDTIEKKWKITEEEMKQTISQQEQTINTLVSELEESTKTIQDLENENNELQRENDELFAWKVNTQKTITKFGIETGVLS